MTSFNILKKNRKYFAATKNGHKCKILIDDNSKDLELGNQVLEVDNISVSTRYGTDYIYRMKASINELKEFGIVTLRSEIYNSRLVAACHRLDGRWDRFAGAWTFSGLVEDEVEKLDEKYNSEPIGIEITFNEKITHCCAAVCVGGFKIAEAKSRDGGATIPRGVAVIAGGATSGGSWKNWITEVEGGTIVRMNIPVACLDDVYSEAEKLNAIVKVLE